MFDELERLRDVKELLTLLRHYQHVGEADRQAWQDRLTELEGVEPRQMVKLHGELLAYGWLEQNTGLTPVLRGSELLSHHFRRHSAPQTGSQARNANGVNAP